MATVKRSLVIVFLERYALTALQLASYVLLARLLSPNEVGIYATLAAVLAIVQVVRDFGVGTFIIQHAKLDHAITRQALGVTYSIALLLFIALNVGAGAAARFYGEPQVETILRVMSLNLLIYPFNSISMALLRRDLEFATIAKSTVGSTLVGTCCTLLFAWLGHGPISLAFGELASSLVMMTALVTARGWLTPSVPALSKCREIFSIGGATTLAGIVTSASMNSSDIVAGKVLNFTEVGIASRAMGLMNLFHRDVLGSIRSVMFPAFARAWRDGENVEQRHVRAVSLTTAIAWPFYGLVSLFPLEVLRLMFGPQWDASAVLVPVYCIAGAVSVMNAFVPSLMQACGHAKLAALADLIIQPIRAGLLIGVLMYWQALLPLALGYLAMSLVAVPYFYAFKQRILPSDFPTLLREVGRNAALALLCLLPTGLLAAWLRPPGEALALPVWLGCCVLAGLIWLAGLRVLHHPLFAELQSLVSSRRKPAPAP
jgi:lipopolysaccharide exporter